MESQHGNRAEYCDRSRDSNVDCIINFQCSSSSNYSDVTSESSRLHRKATNDRKNRAFVCKFCGKAFSQVSHMQNHERIHTGVRPFKCKFCDRNFSDRSNCKSHERIHTGERPYVCKVCSKTFGKSWDLRRHERIHAGDPPIV